jgi:hypothetical protein
VAAVAALAQGTEQIAQRAVAEEVERLVGDFEGDRLLAALAGAAAAAAFALLAEVGRHRDVAFLTHALDDLLNQFLELRTRVALIAVGRIAEQPLDALLRQHAAVEQRVQNRIMQRLHRPLGLVGPVRVGEPARQQQVGQLRHQILEIQIVEQVAGELRVAILHWLRASGSGFSRTNSEF